MGMDGVNMEIRALVSDGRTVLVERRDHIAMGSKQVLMEVVGVFEIGDDGLIARWSEYYDLQSVRKRIKEALGS
jgi:limonene-1,2-epoxide hydrolase